VISRASSSGRTPNCTARRASVSAAAIACFQWSASAETSTAGGDERRVLGARQRRQPAVEHRQAELFDDLAPTLGHRVGREVGRRHPGQLHRRRRAGLDRQAHVGPARRHLAEIGVVAGRSLALPVGEPGLDLGLHRGRIDVADHHQGGALGAIVAVVDVGDQVGLGRLDHRHEADREALRRALAVHGEAEPGLGHPVGRGVAQPLLGEDHAALLVHRALVQQQVAGDLAQQHQRGVDGLVVGFRQVELVDRGVEAGLGVGVGAEGQAQPLQVLHHLAAGRHVGRTIESHVLEEVRQALLVVALHLRADVETQPH
jgi:hypothetical protein